MTVIIFAPAHDLATCSNAAIAGAIISQTDLALIGVAAKRAALLDAITSRRYSYLFLMAHGSQDHVFEDEDSFALGVDDCNELHGKKIFAWACNTSRGLGLVAANAGATWIGYGCPVTAPSDSLDFFPGFRDLFHNIKIEFKNVCCAASAQNFLLWLEGECNSLVDQFCEILNENNGCEFSALSCCSQIWGQVKIFLPGPGPAICHPNAPPPYIDFL